MSDHSNHPDSDSRAAQLLHAGSPTPAELEARASVLRAGKMIAPRMKALCERDTTEKGDGVTVHGEGVKVVLKKILGPYHAQRTEKGSAGRDHLGYEIRITNNSKAGDVVTRLSHHFNDRDSIFLDGQALSDKGDDVILVNQLLDKIDKLVGETEVPVTQGTANVRDNLRAVLGKL